MFAIISSGSKQYMVKSGAVIKVEKKSGDVGQLIQFDKVLMLNNEVGSPYVEGAVVTAEILEQTKTDKVLVFKKKRRHNYRRKRGHRQQITVVRIKEVQKA